MVDPTKLIPPVQNVTSIGKSPAPAESKRTEEKKEPAPASDTVEISDEASEAQARDAAAKARVILQNNKDVTLGLNPAFVDQTV